MSDDCLPPEDHSNFQGLRAWTVTDSSYVLNDQWMTVRADSCKAADGTDIAPYYVIESSDWVSMAVFDDQCRMLITRLYRHGNREMSFEIPAGMVDEADGDPLTAAKRELQEETGFYGGEFKHLSSLTPNSARYNNSIHNFMVTGVLTTGAPSQDASEEILFEFLPVPQVLAMIRDGRFRQSTQIATIYMALQELGWLTWAGPE